MAHLDAIDRGKPQKLYHQLSDIFKSRIETGDWKVGAQIPTEERLCSLYNVSKATVRLAIEELVSLGYLKKFQGKGTFVRRRKPDHTIPLLTNLAENGICNNPSCISRLVEYRLTKPDDHIRSFLGANDADFCHYVAKLTLTADTPFLLQKLYLPYDLLPAPLGGDNEELGGGAPLYLFLEKKCGLKIHRIRELVDVAQSGEKDGALLELLPDQAVLRSRHFCYAPGGIPIVYSEFLYQTAAFARTVEFERLTI